MNTAILLGVLSLLSAVLGVLLGGALQWRADRRRWRREDRQRWHERRVDAYATTLDRLTRVFIAFRSAAETARPRLQPPWTPRIIRRRMSVAETALYQAQEQLYVISLVGSAEAVAAAEECLQVIQTLADDLGEWSRSTPPTLFDERLEELTAARDRLVAVGRQELDVDHR